MHNSNWQKLTLQHRIFYSVAVRKTINLKYGGQAQKSIT